MHAHHMQPSWYAIHTNEYAISSQKAYPVPRGCLCNPNPNFAKYQPLEAFERGGWAAKLET